MHYRREIDGLRALAVLPVILFHADIAMFSGGFVGVDVFFVISGYLITSMIVAEKKKGTFTLSNFYERRARRILPALFTVLFASLAAAWMLLLPSEMRHFLQSVVAVSTFASNFFFLRHSGYFDTFAELNPLLHTWSLAVEEQYYLLFPIVLLLAWRLGSRSISGVFLIAAIASLALAHWGSANQPEATFYLLPTRCWELLIGALIAIQYPPTREPGGYMGAPTLAKQCAGVAGLLLILVAVFFFDENTPVPSLWTLIPVGGAVLVILFATPKTVVGGLLSTRLLVGIGLLSYSIYLWHWPLFAFAWIQSPAPPSSGTLLSLVALSVAMAYVSWRYIEQPARDRRRVGSAAFIGTVTLAGIILCGIGFAGRMSALESRYSTSERELLSFARYARGPLYREGECFLRPEQDHSEFAHHCGRGASNGNVLLIWGDSHAAALSVGFRLTARDVAQYTASGCPPAVRIAIHARPQCKGINEFAMREIARIRPREVLLHANWSKYAKRDIAMDVLETIHAIRDASPASKIVVVGGVPQWPKPLPHIMLREGVLLDKVSYISVPILPKLRMIDEGLRRVAVQSTVSFLSAIDLSCIDKSCQSVYEQDGKFEPAAWDYGHLTQMASAVLAAKLLAALGNGR